MRHFLIAIGFALVAACATEPQLLEDSNSTGLVKTSYTVQADDTGFVEFQLPDHNSERGPALVQTYELAMEKFSHLVLAVVPHEMDAKGMIWVVTAPDSHVIVVAVR